MNRFQLIILAVLPSLAFATLDIFNSGCFRCGALGIFSECISYSHVCDGDFDCPNGADEANCPFICPYPQYYKCADNGVCISSMQLCDGHPDCVNGEDEWPQYCGNGYNGYMSSRFPNRPYPYRGARSFIANENATLVK